MNTAAKAIPSDWDGKNRRRITPTVTIALVGTLIGIVVGVTTIVATIKQSEARSVRMEEGLKSLEEKQNIKFDFVIDSIDKLGNKIDRHIGRAD